MQSNFDTSQVAILTVSSLDVKRNGNISRQQSKMSIYERLQFRNWSTPPDGDCYTAKCDLYMGV